MKKIITLILLVAFFVAGTGLAVQAEKTIMLAHLNPQNPKEVATAAMADVFKSMVETGTNGTVEVDIFPDGVLGSEREMMEQVQGGVIQSFISSAGGLTPFYPLMSIVDIPFSISDLSVAYRVYDGDFGDYLAEDIEETTRGFEVLAFGESGGFFQLTNNVRPITSPEDMEGLSFRTMSIGMHREFMRSLGASPTDIAWAEVYTSLSTGVVDGQHNPIPIIHLGLLYEVQDYMTVSNHMYAPYVWVINEEFMNGLTEHEQRVVKEAARVANVAGRGVNRLLEASDQGLPFLAEEMEVYVPTEEELQAFRDVTVPAAMDFIESEYGEEGLDLAERYLEAIDEARAELGME